jgi:hypothetical protein
MIEFMRVWAFYHRLALQDLFRLWSTTQHHVIIVAGICLPILLLLGLKRGHVAQLREELLTSPSGRQVVFWSAQQGELLSSNRIVELQKELVGTDIIIPEQQRLVRIEGKPDANNSLPPTELVTLYSTRSGDPILRQVDADTLSTADRAVVLPERVAARLGVKKGDLLRVVIERDKGREGESAFLDVVLKAVIPSQESASIGYADVALLDLFEQYVRGYRVAELNWPAARVSAKDRYSKYLVFCESTGDLKPGDFQLLRERGLTIDPVSVSDLPGIDRVVLGEHLKNLRIYRISASDARSGPSQRLTLAPSDISELTETDDVVVPWNEPWSFSENDQHYRVFGLSLPKRTWMREYLIFPDLAFPYDSEPFVSRLVHDRPEISTFQLPLSEKLNVSLKVIHPEDSSRGETPERSTKPTSTEESLNQSKTPETDATTQQQSTGADSDSNDDKAAQSGAGDDGKLYGPMEIDESVPSDSNSMSMTPTLVIIPADLFAHIDAFRNDAVTYDPTTNLFVPKPEPPVYDKARLYARTIDEVPSIVDQLMAKQFAVMSESTRITEIHEQDRSLRLLVWVVGAGVFLFGVITVVSVLLDSTDRKRGTIGILRVMGVSRPGVFYLVVFRAAAIGLLAGFATFVAGFALAHVIGWKPDSAMWYLSWKPVIKIDVSTQDAIIVVLGALGCSCFGAIIPAWRASRLDPFDAIVEGRFR